MSEELEILEALFSQSLDQPVATANAEEECILPLHEKKLKKGENSKPSHLQMRYQRQMRDRRDAQIGLIDRMSRLVAWTWMPGKNRQECPDFVNIRDARLLVMDRFPDQPDDYPTRIGLSMYRPSVQQSGHVIYAGPTNIEMFKDFSLRPHFHAGGLILDCENTEVFRTALELDHAMELVAREKRQSDVSFIPLPTLFAFPHHFMPMPEWQLPMQEAIRQQLQLTSRTLKCLLSPGGTVVGIANTNDGFRTITLEKEGNLISIRVPSWIIIQPNVKIGITVHEGLKLADLPRDNFSTIREVLARFPFKSLEWLMRRILEEKSELLQIEEDTYDQESGNLMKRTCTWNCLPSQFVRTQVGRTTRRFIDFRKKLNRLEYSIDGLGNDIWTENENESHIFVRQFSSRPTLADLQFSDGRDDSDATWYADLMSSSPEAMWAGRTGLRGLAA